MFFEDRRWGVCVDNPGLWLPSVEILEFTVLHLLCLLAAFGPLQHMSAVWLALWQCQQGGYVFAFGLSVVRVSTRRSCSLRRHYRHFLMIYPGNLQHQQMIYCSSALCGWVCLFTVIVVVDVVGLCNSPSVSGPLSLSSFSKCATIRSYVPFSKYTKLIDRLRCGGFLAYEKLSLICCGRCPEARLTLSFKSSKKSEKELVLRSKVSLRQ